MRTSLSTESGYNKDILLQILNHSLTNSLACDAGGINFSRVRGWWLGEREKFKKCLLPILHTASQVLANFARVITIRLATDATNSDSLPPNVFLSFFRVRL